MIYIFAVIENFCSAKPNENTSNSIAPSKFTRSLNSSATLTCASGYSKSGSGTLNVTCIEKSATAGVWSKASATCIGVNKSVFSLNTVYNRSNRSN